MIDYEAFRKLSDRLSRNSKDYYTLIFPLEENEEPASLPIAKTMMDLFGDLPFAEGRLPLAEAEIETDSETKLRYVAVRLKKWAIDATLLTQH